MLTGGAMNFLERVLNESERNDMILGVSLALAGAVMVAFPMFSGMLMAVLLSLVLISLGSCFLVWGVTSSSTLAKRIYLAVGGGTGLIAVVMFYHPTTALAGLIFTVLVAMFMNLSSGIARTIEYPRSEGWNRALAGGVMSLIMAVLLVSHGADLCFDTVALYLGIRLLFSAMMITVPLLLDAAMSKTSGTPPQVHPQ